MLDRIPRAGRAAALLAAALLTLTLATGSADPSTTFEIVDGETSYVVYGRTGEVETALAQAGVAVGPRDLVTSDVQTDGTVRVLVERPVTTYEETIREYLPYETLRQEDPDLPLGQEIVLQAGTQGVVVDRTKVVTDPDGTVHRYDLGSAVTAQPVDEIVAYGTKVEAVPASWLSVSDDVLTNLDPDGSGGGVLTTASGTEMAYTQVLRCRATAYTTQRQSWKLTATGTTARVGAIAVDPDVIPYGTRMFIVSADGTITYGVATAEDCGGAIQGNRIDLFFDTYDECIQFGVRDCDVYLLA